jgi:hypothetical protein
LYACESKEPSVSKRLDLPAFSLSALSAANFAALASFSNFLTSALTLVKHLYFLVSLKTFLLEVFL